MIDLFFPFAGFVFGSIPCSYLAARMLTGKDVRREGSGNVGATNVFRVAGRSAGIAAVAGDVLKSLVPVLAARLAGSSPLWQAVTSAAVIAGHCYSPFLKFRGGKGVISTVAVSLLLSWPAALAFGVVWLGVFLSRGYVSLASILASLALPLGSVLAHADRSTTIFFSLASLFLLFKHRENVRRLLAGTESRMRK
ncbi:MAG: glycerol-3-phosphate 1-O-acyltransferase PlsY [Candidatus Methylomirabilia bacterium]